MRISDWRDVCSSDLIVLPPFANEMFQLAEGFPAFDSFSDGHLLAVDLSERQIERRFAARSRRMGKDVQRRREHRAPAHIRKRIGWIIQKFRAAIGHYAPPGQQIPMAFVSII